MFRKIGDALRRFMAGRYGSDKLNQWMLGLAIVLIVLGLIGGRAGSAVLSALGVVAYVPLIWSLFRTYSRNIEARRRENAAFQRVLTQLKDRDHRYYHCPKCRQTVRVPRGRGQDQYPLSEVRRAVREKELNKVVLIFLARPAIIVGHVHTEWYRSGYNGPDSKALGIYGNFSPANPHEYWLF